MDFPAAQEGFHLGPHFLNKVFLIVYQKSTKKETQPLAAQGAAFFPVFGCLPDVYQGYFLSGKSDKIPKFVRCSKLFRPCEDCYTGLLTEIVPQNLEKGRKRPTF